MWVEVTALIDGDMVVTGSIGTSNLVADSITAEKLAISLDSAAGSGIFMNSSSNVIQILESGVTRVKIGNLS